MKATTGTPIPPSGCAASVPMIVASAEVARILPDSTVLIDALRGRPTGERLRALRRRGDEPWTCAISTMREIEGALADILGLGAGREQ